MQSKLPNQLILQKFKQKYTSPYCHHIISINHEADPIPQYSGNLFLSGVQGLHKNIVRDYGISAVLTLMDQWTYGYNQMDKRIQELNLIGEHKWIDLEDDTESSIYKHFQDALSFLETKLKDKNVLVHCHMGISRSASIVLAFLMRNYQMSLDEAYNHTVGIRDTIEPNEKFWKELQKYQKELKKKKQI